MGYANLLEGHSTVCDGCSDCAPTPDRCAECGGAGPLVRHTDDYDYCQPCAAYYSEPQTEEIALRCSGCERTFASLAEMVESDHPCAEAR